METCASYAPQYFNKNMKKETKNKSSKKRELKVGDKVRMIKDTCCHGFPIGSIRTITYIVDDKYYSENKSDDGCYFTKEDVVLVGSNYKTKQPNFLLKYEIDKDPFEEFYTLKDLKECVIELTKSGGHNFVVYKIAKKIELNIEKVESIKIKGI